MRVEMCRTTVIAAIASPVHLALGTPFQSRILLTFCGVRRTVFGGMCARLQQKVLGTEHCVLAKWVPGMCRGNYAMHQPW